MKILYTAVTVLFLSWFVTGSSLAGELSPLYPGYPEVFDISGTLDWKDENRVVINDNNFPVNSSTSYHSPHGPTSLINFSERDQVGALLAPKSMEIKSLWLTKAATPMVKKKKEEENSPRMIQENGVWKN